MSNSQHWYVLHIATPLNEAPILQSLRRHKVDAEFWFPKYKTTKQLKKKAKPILKPVFSTYAFLRCDYDLTVVRAVEEIPGCYFVPAASDNILPVTVQEIQTLKKGIEKYTSDTPQPPQFWNNRSVEIISGCFAGYTAIVKAAVKDTIVAEINIFGRTVPITLKSSEVTAI